MVLADTPQKTMSQLVWCRKRGVPALKQSSQIWHCHTYCTFSNTVRSCLDRKSGRAPRERERQRAVTFFTLVKDFLKVANSVSTECAFSPLSCSYCISGTNCMTACQTSFSDQFGFDFLLDPIQEGETLWWMTDPCEWLSQGGVWAWYQGSTRPSYDCADAHFKRYHWHKISVLVSGISLFSAFSNKSL